MMLVVVMVVIFVVVLVTIVAGVVAAVIVIAISTVVAFAAVVVGLEYWKNSRDTLDGLTSENKIDAYAACQKFSAK